MDAEQRAEAVMCSADMQALRQRIAAAIRAAEQAARKAALEEAAEVAVQAYFGEPIAEAIRALAQKEDGRGE